MEKECFIHRCHSAKRTGETAGHSVIGRRQRQVDLRNFKASVVYIVSFKTARDTDSPCLKEQNKSSSQAGPTISALPGRPRLQAVPSAVGCGVDPGDEMTATLLAELLTRRQQSSYGNTSTGFLCCVRDWRGTLYMT